MLITITIVFNQKVIIMEQGDEQKIELSKKFFDYFDDLKPGHSFDEKQAVDKVLDMYKLLSSEIKAAAAYYMSQPKEAENLYQAYLKLNPDPDSNKKDNYKDSLLMSMASINEDGRINGAKYNFQAIRAYGHFMKTTDLPNKFYLMNKFESFAQAYLSNDFETYKHFFEDAEKEVESLTRDVEQLANVYEKNRRDIKDFAICYDPGRLSLWTANAYENRYNSRKNLPPEHEIDFIEPIAKHYRYQDVSKYVRTIIRLEILKLSAERIERKQALCSKFLKAVDMQATADNEFPKMKLNHRGVKKALLQFDSLYKRGNLQQIESCIDQFSKTARRSGLKDTAMYLFKRGSEKLGIKKGFFDLGYEKS